MNFSQKMYYWYKLIYAYINYHKTCAISLNLGLFSNGNECYNFQYNNYIISCNIEIMICLSYDIYWIISSGIKSKLSK
jgi:hypothetical protein